MPETESADDPKEFLIGQREFYEEEAGRVVTEVLNGLEAIRPSLGIHPGAFPMAVDEVTGMPYRDGDPLRDAFTAMALVRALESFAVRLREVGIRDTENPHAHLGDVDLSAGKDVEGVDDKGIRDSYHDRGEDDEPVARTENEVAESAEVADDKVIRDSLDVAGLDKVAEDSTAAEATEALSRIGADTDHSIESDDVEEEDEEDSGSERVQLGTLDPSGTPAEPSLCARETVRILFEGVVNGYEGSNGSRPGLAARIAPLEEYGVIHASAVRMLLQRLLVNVQSISFFGSVARGD